MTSSALQAAALGDVAWRGRASPSDDLPKRFHRKAARIIEAPWRIAVGGDFGHPATVGTRPVGTAQLNGYMVRVIHAAPRVPARHAVVQPRAPARGPADGPVRPADVVRVLRASAEVAGRDGRRTCATQRVGPALRVGSA